MDLRDEALLNDLLDGRLASDEADALRRRIASDADLAEAWRELEQMRTALRGDATERAPEALLAGVRARLAAEGAAAAAPRLRWLRGGLAAAAAMAAVLLVALGLAGRRTAPGPRPPAGETARGTPGPADGGPEAPAPGVGAPHDALVPPPGAPEALAGRVEPRAAPQPDPRGDGRAAPMTRVDRATEGEVARPAVGLRAGPADAPVAVSYVLEVPDLAAGRAQLALLVAGLEAPATGPAREGLMRAPDRLADALVERRREAAETALRDARRPAGEDGADAAPSLGTPAPVTPAPVTPAPGTPAPGAPAPAAAPVAPAAPVPAPALPWQPIPPPVEATAPDGPAAPALEGPADGDPVLAVVVLDLDPEVAERLAALAGGPVDPEDLQRAAPEEALGLGGGAGTGPTPPRRAAAPSGRPASPAAGPERAPPSEPSGPTAAEAPPPAIPVPGAVTGERAEPAAQPPPEPGATPGPEAEPRPGRWATLPDGRVRVRVLLVRRR